MLPWGGAITCSEDIMAKTNTTIKLGMSKGRVMRLSVRQGEALSIKAASYTSLGMACKPASKMRV